MRYKSNLDVDDLTPAFRHTHVSEKACGHDVLGDNDFEPDCGYITHDEAAILFHVSRTFPGEWLEIGSHTGWSAAHIALSGNTVTAIDPQFSKVAFFLRTYGNLKAAEVADRIRLFAGTAESFFQEEPNSKFMGAFIDGDHGSPGPLNDAKEVLPHLQEDAVVIFHDFTGWPIREGTSYLVQRGFRFHVYNTPQMIAVCYRGKFVELPQHVPDPTINWERLRQSMTDFDFQGEQ